MEHKILERVFKQGIMTLVMMLVFLSPINLCAEEFYFNSEYDLPCNASIWDITGSYDDDEMLDCDLTMNLVQDGKGKITGYGCADCETNIDGVWIGIDFCYDVKGSVKQKKRIAEIKMKMKFKGTGDVPSEDLYNLKFNGTEQLKAVINSYAQTIEGMMKVKACIQKVGCEKTEVVFEEDLPYDMDGAWFLDVNVDDDGKKIIGDAVLTLANGRQLHMAAKGKINTKKEEAKVTFKGLKTDADAKGNSLQVTVDDDINIISFKGNVLNQKIQCK